MVAVAVHERADVELLKLHYNVYNNILNITMMQVKRER